MLTAIRAQVKRSSSTGIDANHRAALQVLLTDETAPIVMRSLWVNSIAEIKRRAESGELDSAAGGIEEGGRRWSRRRSTESLLACKERKLEARSLARHRYCSRLRTQVAK